MPSYGFPLLGQFYFAIILEMGVSIAVTTLILNFYHRNRKRMPKTMRKVILQWLARILFPCQYQRIGAKFIDVQPYDRKSAIAGTWKLMGTYAEASVQKIKVRGVVRMSTRGTCRGLKPFARFLQTTLQAGTLILQKRLQANKGLFKEANKEQTS